MLKVNNDTRTRQDGVFCENGLNVLVKRFILTSSLRLLRAIQLIKLLLRELKIYLH